MHFAAFPTHIGFYPAPSGMEAFKKELSGYKSAKGSVQFPIHEALPLLLIRRIVERESGTETKKEKRFQEELKRRDEMIKKFAGASIWSEDLNNLLPFYRDVLGLKVVHESEGFVVLGEDQSDWPTLGLGTHSEVHGHNSDPARHMVGFETDDLAAEWQRLKDAGVEFIEQPTEYGSDMSIATLKDPEGNLVQLWQYRGLS